MKDFHKKESPILGLTGSGGGLGYLAGGGGAESLYVDDVFSTYLFDGNGSSQQIQNGINLSDEGGLVWIKRRNNTDDYRLFDTERASFNKFLTSSGTAAETFIGNFGSTNSDGFTMSASATGWNETNGEYCSWTFRKAPGFFDIVTYTGNDSSGTYTTTQTISHNLEANAGMVIVRPINNVQDWYVIHDNSNPYVLILNSSSGDNTADEDFGYSSGGASSFNVKGPYTNANGVQYIAYVFGRGSSDGAIYGENGDESVIKCGSYTGNSSSDGPEINLGWEPQFVMIKRRNQQGDWMVFDTMRGMVASSSGGVALKWDAPDAEAGFGYVRPASTGFKLQTTASNVNSSSGNNTYVYMAIRRPHKPPTAGTDVFNAVTRSGVNATTSISSGNSRVTDMIWTKNRNTGNSPVISARLQGSNALDTSGTSEEGTSWNSRLFWDEQNGVRYAQYDQVNQSGSNYIDYFFTRTPGVFDVVTYKANNNVAFNVNHNLGVAPELIMIKDRTSSGRNWLVGADALTGWGNYGLKLNDTAGENTSSNYFTGAPTSTQFKLGTASDGNYGTDEFIAFLFASKPGISKVGYYTGTGSDGLEVDCGFTNGARFVMVKRVDGTGNWNLFDTARGINAGYDPQLAFNSSNSELTNNDFIDTLSSGFIINNTGTAMNGNGGKYMFLAIA